MKRELLPINSNSKQASSLSLCALILCGAQSTSYSTGFVATRSPETKLLKERRILRQRQAQSTPIGIVSVNFPLGPARISWELSGTTQGDILLLHHSYTQVQYSTTLLILCSFSTNKRGRSVNSNIVTPFY